MEWKGECGAAVFALNKSPFFVCSFSSAEKLCVPFCCHVYHGGETSSKIKRGDLSSNGMVEDEVGRRGGGSLDQPISANPHTVSHKKVRSRNLITYGAAWSSLSAVVGDNKSSELQLPTCASLFLSLSLSLRIDTYTPSPLPMVLLFLRHIAIPVPC